MASVKISQLPQATSTNPSDELPIVQGGVTKRISKEDLLGYKVYTALLTQTGLTAPSAIVLENTIGTVTWAYEGLGQYSATFFGYTPQKIVVFTGAGTAGSKTYVIQGYENPFPPYGVWIDTSDSTTGLGLDNVLVDAPIEIRIYP